MTRSWYLLNTYIYFLISVIIKSYFSHNLTYILLDSNGNSNIHEHMIARNYFYLSELNASLTAQNLSEYNP